MLQELEVLSVRNEDLRCKVEVLNIEADKSVRELADETRRLNCINQEMADLKSAKRGNGQMMESLRNMDDTLVLMIEEQNKQLQMIDGLEIDHIHSKINYLEKQNSTLDFQIQTAQSEHN